MPKLNELPTTLEQPLQAITVEDVAGKVPNGASLATGGLISVSEQQQKVDGLVRRQKRHLTAIADGTARPDRGIGKLVSASLVDRVIASHIRLNPETQQRTC